MMAIWINPISNFKNTSTQQSFSCRQVLLLYGQVLKTYMAFWLQYHVVLFVLVYENHVAIE